jgi:hypothetical protein
MYCTRLSQVINSNTINLYIHWLIRFIPSSMMKIEDHRVKAATNTVVRHEKSDDLTENLPSKCESHQEI